MTAPAPTRLDGKVAVVTGASRGIGYAVAQRLVAEGARVLLTARKEEALVEAVARLGPERAAYVAGPADAADHQEEAVTAAVERFGHLDLLVNNAGTNTAYGPMLEVEQSASGKMFDVNVLAALGWSTRAVRASLGAKPGAAIVNVASVAGLMTSQAIGVYGVTKAALIHLTRQLAVELGPAVRVNAVAPAVVQTRFAAALYEGREDAVAAPYPLKRLGEPKDVAGAVAFLLSGDAAWITGHTIVVDGGITLVGGAE